MTMKPITMDQNKDATHYLENAEKGFQLSRWVESINIERRIKILWAIAATSVGGILVLLAIIGMRIPQSYYAHLVTLYFLILLGLTVLAPLGGLILLYRAKGIYEHGLRVRAQGDAADATEAEVVLIDAVELAYTDEVFVAEIKPAYVQNLPRSARSRTVRRAAQKRKVAMSGH